MKKVLTIILAIALCFTVIGCGASEKQIEKAEFDSVTMIDDFELTVNKDILTATQLNGDQDQHEEFLTTDMTNYGDTVLCDITIVAKQDNTMVVVSYSLKNIEKNNSEFDEKIALNFNNGYEYEAEEKYYAMGSNDSWHSFTSLEIKPLTTVSCKAQFTVPKEVMENTESPLKLTIANKEYTIR